MTDESKKEREILMVMRKVLSTIVRELTPEHRSLKHPLSDDTIQDIRMCMGLITAREKELADAAGRTAVERPYYTDQPRASTVVPMTKIGKTNKKQGEEEG
ncbi:MAG: segregation and condensation protein A [Chromatiales bacterium]|jgi:hypothetical protein